VNKKLGKKRFKCTIGNLDLRWKTGDASCWEFPDVIKKVREDQETVEEKKL
jgi:hypothetical protein